MAAAERLRILLVNQYFPPDTSATAKVHADLALALVAAGHRVEVIAGRPSYAPTERHRWRLTLIRRSHGITIHTAGSTVFGRNTKVGRALNYFSFLIIASIMCIARRNRNDVVVVGTDPPLAVVAAILAAGRFPVVYSLQDLHPDAAVSAGLLRRGALTLAWDKLHSYALRRCASVVCLGEEMRERVIAKGVSRHRTKVILTGAPPPASVPDPATVAALRGGSTFCIVHAGNIGSALPLDTLAAAQAQAPDARILFVGDGVLAERARALGLAVTGFLPETDIASVMAAGDMQLVALKEGMAGMVVPSKVFTALAYGRPILAIVPAASEVARLVTHYDCGVVVPPVAGDVAAALLMLQEERPFAGLADAAARAGRDMSRTKSLESWVRLIEALT